MARDMLLSIFCWKLNQDLEQFSERMERKGKTEIIASAYKIDSMFMIYELLLEMAPAMTGEELEALDRQEGLLELVYQDWMQVADSRNDEMIRFLTNERKQLMTRTGPAGREEGYAA